MDKVAVVILNWNGCEMLRSFLPSVVRCSDTEGTEIYVADNGSTDASVEMLRQEFPSVHLIILDKNRGFAEGYNLALQQVSAEYVVLLNSDVEVTGHWLAPLVDYMDAHGLAYDKSNGDHLQLADEWDVAITSLESRLEELGTNTQQEMVYIQDYMGQYNSYLQGANTQIANSNQTLTSLARGQ